MTLWIWDRLTRTWMPSILPVDRPYPLGPSATLIPLGDGRYGVMASERLRVNGETILPLRALEDRDELQRPGELPCYVSVDDEPEVAPFPGGAGACRCARCGSAIAPGSPSIQCPRCRCWAHQIEDLLPCWAHAPVCPACPQPTRGRAWEPEPLGPPCGGVMRADDD
jgi:hypothetical protein